MDSYEQQKRFEKFMIQQGKSPTDFEFLIEYDTPRQSDAFPVTGRVMVKNKTDDRSVNYSFDSSRDWLVEFASDISKALI
jgi:hypothetical protein